MNNSKFGERLDKKRGGDATRTNENIVEAERTEGWRRDGKWLHEIIPKGRIGSHWGIGERKNAAREGSCHHVKIGIEDRDKAKRWEKFDTNGTRNT
jgi:hypothetical protein